MIPNNKAVATVETTFTGRRLKMGVKAADMAHITGVLSEVYTDPVEAVAREYITNAMDSHADAGQTRPVEVTLPNAWQHNLIVQDFGVGMDVDLVEDVFVNYGASTKRTSNTGTGMIGIGSKSAFAYSNSFIVTAVKDGRRVVLSASRDDYGQAVTDIVDESDTDEPNGVKIQIPVSNRHEMTAAVSNFARYLPKGALLVDGKDLSVRDNWTLLAQNIADASGNVVIKNLWMDDSQTYGYSASNHCRIIMGAVAYSPNSNILENSDYNTPPIIAEVAMGSVVFAPSREKLMNVPVTQRVEKLIRDSYNEYMLAAIKKEITEADNHYDAMTTYHRHITRLARLGVRDMEYKGDKIPGPREWAASSNSTDNRIICRTLRPTRHRGGYGNEHALTWEEINNAYMLVTGAPDKALSLTVKNKTLQYAVKNNITFDGAYNRAVLFFPDTERAAAAKLLKSPWFRGIKTVDYADIAAEVLPKTPRSAGGGGGIKTSGKHFVYNENGHESLTEVENDAKILYFVKTQALEDWNFLPITIGRNTFGRPIDRREKFPDFMAALHQYKDDDTLLISVYANRLDKFIKEHPNATELTFDKASGIIREGVRDSVTDEDLAVDALLRNNKSYHIKSWVDVLPQDDPEAKSLIDAIENKGGATKSTLAMYRHLFSNEKDYNERLTKALNRANELLDVLSTRYPLVRSYRSYVNEVPDEP